MNAPFLRRTAALALALSVFLTLPVLAAEKTQRPWRGATYIVTRPGEDPLIIDGSGEPDLTGYPLAFRDSGRSRDLAIAPRQNLTVRHNGETYTLASALTPFCELFESLGFTVSPLEAVRIELFRGRVEVTVTSDISYYERDVEVTPYRTIHQANASMHKGEEAVVQVGAAGERGGVYEVYWSHGAVAGRQLVQLLDNEPVDEIIEYGTAEPSREAIRTPEDDHPRDTEPSQETEPSQDAESHQEAEPSQDAEPAQEAESSRKAGASAGTVSVSRDNAVKDGSGTLTLPGGEILRFTKTVSMSATAYTMGHGGVGSSTASGTTVRRGVVAVDRSVIPLGTKLYVVANGGVVYGEAVAEDTGVRGNRIDLYFDTYRECLQFGRRNCMVYILE